ncbi:MAG: NifB/NifX family molybdenum-iron cluster-binding protein [Candidatus Cloacimonadota bacterium]|nr:NifB/NifX family molybdenum-iron cluster-binding protein [Candidatus Cloacimonadota bacterium]
MKKILVAFATDDGNNFMDRHFGDANYYDIYEINETGADFVKRIDNTTEEEEEHADPKKAKGITNLLLKENVQVVVSKIFGPNIKRIKKKFVCVVMNDESIEDSMNRICKNIRLVMAEWEKGKDRKHLILRTSE